MSSFDGLLALSTLLLLLCPLLLTSGQVYSTEMTQTQVLGTEPSTPAKNTCHCKVKCAVRSDCLAATFVDSDSTCHISTGPQTSITTAALTTGTSWFKFARSIFLSRGMTQYGNWSYIDPKCTSDGGVTVDLLTQEHKDMAVALVAALGEQYFKARNRWAWLVAVNSGGGPKWSDGTLVTSTVFTNADITGSGSFVLLRNDGKIELRLPTNTWGSPQYPVVCISK